MRNTLKFFFILTFGFICLTTNYAIAQDKATTYQSLISSGDKEYAKKEYIKAKTYYQEALRLKPNDASAKSKLDNTLLRIREENKKEEQFFEYIDNADALYNAGELEKALAEYNKAIKIRPKDEYANNKKEEINATLKAEKEKMDSFNEMVAVGDRLLKSERLAEAVMQYESALKIYPNNKNVQAKLQDAKNKKEAYDSKTSEFEQLKSKGEEFTLRKKYAEAISYYEQALQIFPEETELSDKIKDLRNKKNVSERYDAKINEADSYFESNSYNEAKAAYQSALAVIPDDPYASGMIERIEEIVNDPEYKKSVAANSNNNPAPTKKDEPAKITDSKSLLTLVSEPFEVKKGEAKRIDFKPLDVKMRRNSSLTFKAKNTSDKKFILYISYGKNKAKNGGFTVTIPNDGETKDYTVKLGTQYKWFSEDNNWIEILPENGSIEITTMEITKDK